MYAMLMLTALAQPAAEPAAPSGMPPEQVLAVIDAKGKLTITYVTCACYGQGGQEIEVEVQETKGTDKVVSKVKVKVASVNVTTVEVPAKHVEAFTADGRAVSAEKLATLLAKEKTVLIAMDGKKVDPFHLSLYKDDTLVLVPPANTMNMGGYAGGYGVTGAVPVPDFKVPPPPPTPDEKKDEKKDGKRPQ